MTHNLHDPAPPPLSLRNKRWWVSRLLLIFALAMPVEAGRCFCAVNSYGRFFLSFSVYYLKYIYFFFNTTASFVNNSLSGSLGFNNLCNRLYLCLASFLHGFLDLFFFIWKTFKAVPESSIFPPVEKEFSSAYFHIGSRSMPM